MLSARWGQDESGALTKAPARTAKSDISPPYPMSAVSSPSWILFAASSWGARRLLASDRGNVRTNEAEARYVNRVHMMRWGAAENAEDRPREIDRLVFFSDAVFAFALTLLVQRILVPNGPNYTHQVLAQWPKYVSYVISFLVVGRYWLGHHRMFRYIRRWDQRLILLDLLLLFFIAFVPFPAAMIGQHSGYRISLIFYAATVGCAGLASLLIWVYATHDHRLVGPDLDAALIRRYRWSGLVAPCVFFLSIPLSFAGVNVGYFSWLLIPIALAVLRRVGRRGAAAPPDVGAAPDQP
jgi:uncharacterized membrane protein